MTVAYRDFDLNLTPHPVTGDIMFIDDITAVKRAVKNLVLTKAYERPSGAFSDIYQSLFDNIGLMSAINIQTSIRNVILSHEPRVDLQSVEVVEQENGYDVVIRFSVKNIQNNVTIDLFLERIR